MSSIATGAERLRRGTARTRRGTGPLGSSRSAGPSGSSGRPDPAGLLRPAGPLARIGRRYGAVFLSAARTQVTYLGAFLFRNVFLVVILFVMYSLWRVVFADSAIAGFTLGQTLWYLTFTEAVELSRTRLHIDIQDDVRTGAVAYTLTRPYSYVGFNLAQALGSAMVKLWPLLAIGFAVAMVLVGPLDGYVAAFPLGLVAMMAGVVLGTLWVLFIGLLAFWTEDVSPFYWIYQKLVFVLGGMFIPIDFFPDWLAALSARTPFAYQAYWPARMMVAPDAATRIETAVGQAGWIAVLALACALLFARARRRMHAHGG